MVPEQYKAKVGYPNSIPSLNLTIAQNISEEMEVDRQEKNSGRDGRRDGNTVERGRPPRCTAADPGPIAGHETERVRGTRCRADA